MSACPYNDLSPTLLDTHASRPVKLASPRHGAYAALTVHQGVLLLIDRLLHASVKDE